MKSITAGTNDIAPTPVPSWGPSAMVQAGLGAWNRRGPDELRHDMEQHLVLCSFRPYRDRETRLAGSKIRTVSSPPMACEVVPAGADYWARWHEEKEVAVFALDPSWLNGLAMRDFAPECLELKVDALPFKSSTISHFAGLLRREFQLSGGQVGGLYLDSMIVLLGVELLRSHSNLRLGQGNSPRPNLTPRLLARIVEYIRTNLDQPLRIADLAQLADYSPGHFMRAFKAQTGKTPYQFVLDTRIETAETLLRSSKLAISTIASQVGFAGQAHLTAQMRRLRGVTPALYRRLS